MKEKDKMEKGLLYDANDDELLKDRTYCKEQCFIYNHLRPSQTEEQKSLLRNILNKTGNNFWITAPFWCDYDYHIEIGENFFSNHNCTILDGAKVTFGDNVFIGPNCVFSTVGHPFDVQQRN